MKRNKFTAWLLAGFMMLVVVSACGRKKKDAGPSVRGTWTVTQVRSIGDKGVPAEYQAIVNQQAVFTETQYTIGSNSGTYTFQMGQSNQGTIALNPDIYTGGANQYDVTFNNNQMRWVKNVADPSKAETNEVEITFSR